MTWTSITARISYSCCHKLPPFTGLNQHKFISHSGSFEAKIKLTVELYSLQSLRESLLLPLQLLEAVGHP